MLGKGLEVNADNTKYVVVSSEQNAGWSHNIKTDNGFLDRVEQPWQIKIHFRKKLTAVKECLLSVSAEYFVFQFAIQILRH